MEQKILRQSDTIVTIAPGHEKELPAKIRKQGHHVLLQNWANVEEIPELNIWNPWAMRHGLHCTSNIVYSGTLGLKHDLPMFARLAEAFQTEPDVRIVVVSSGQAADSLRTLAADRQLTNLVVLPFQQCEDVPQVLASGSVLIAPLDPCAGSFCVPSKVLSYLCAGRPIVIAIDPANAAAQMIRGAGAGSIVAPGDAAGFIAAIRDLLEDTQKRVAVGAAARAFALGSFSLDRIVPRFLDILARTNIHLTRQAPSVAAPLLVRAATLGN